MDRVEVEEKKFSVRMMGLKTSLLGGEDDRELGPELERGLIVRGEASGASRFDEEDDELGFVGLGVLSLEDFFG